MAPMDLKKIKWLLPVLALLVIFESVLIVQKLNANKSKESLIKEGALPTELQQENAAQISFSGESTAVLGQEGQVSVVMLPIGNLSLDGIDVLIDYDPEYLDIIGITPTDKFSYLARNWIEPDKKRILVSMVETDLPTGVSFQAGDQVTLLTISYLAKKAGTTSLTIVGGVNEAGTVLAENTTAKKLPFTSENIDIVIK